MKKIAFLVLIPLLCIAVIIVINIISAGILSENVDIPANTVYIPKGIADNYKDYAFGTFDTLEKWEYNLTDKEKAEIQNDLDNGVWKKADHISENLIEDFFAFGPDDYRPEKLSDNLYYCIYGYDDKAFVDYHTSMKEMGVSHALFLYDYSENKYYCVNKLI